MGDVLSMRVCDEESEVDVRLSNPEYELPTHETDTYLGLRWRCNFQN